MQLIAWWLRYRETNSRNSAVLFSVSIYLYIYTYTCIHTYINIYIYIYIYLFKISEKTFTIRKRLTGLLTNFFSFTSFSYKVGLIRTLVDRAYKIENSILSFNSDVNKLTHIFKRNQFPEYLISRVVQTYLDNNGNSAQSDNNNTLYFELPYLPFCNFAQCKVHILIKRYCSNLTIKLAFSSFKIKILMKVKDSVPRSLHSCVVYKFTCAWCNSRYVGEMYRHISTRVREHLSQIKIHTFINTCKVLKHVKILVMRAAFKLLIWLKRTINLRLKRLCIFCGRGPI